MTTPAQPAAPTGPGRSGRPRPKRGEGQWALGYTEPLNKNEQTKKDDNPLNVRARIIDIYSKRGFESIDPADLRGRFRWMGLYTQRAPGLDGGKTAMLEEEELDDKFFMMRVRTDGALLTAETVRALGTVGARYARDTADVTDRENIQYHWIRIEDVPAIWEILDAAGLDTTEACGDSPRPFLGSPVAGIAADEIIDGTAALEEIKRRYIGDPAFSNLPRKFKTALTGHPSHDVSPRDQRRLVRRHGAPRARPRLRPVGRWRAVHQPDAGAEARRLDRVEGRPRRLGRGHLGVPRLRLPPAPLAGASEVPRRRLGRAEVPRRAGERVPPPAPWSTTPRPSPRSCRATTSACTRRRTAATTSALAPTVGRISGAVLTGLGDLIERVRRGRGPAHGVPEDRRARPRGGPGRGVPRRRRDASGSPPGRPTGVADHGLHRHRVLQARHRRHQGPRRGARHRAGAPVPRPRHADHGQRQRLPERLRPYPGRRHRAEGPAGARRARRPGRGLPGPPRRRRSGWSRRSARSCAPTRSPAPGSTTTSPTWCGASSPSASPASGSPPGRPARTTRPCAASGSWRRSRHERARRPVPLPLLRRREPCPHRGGGARRLGVPRLPARLHASRCSGMIARPGTASGGRGHDRRDHLGRPCVPRRPAPQGRSEDELKELVRHAGAELELAPGRGHHRVGRRHLRRAVLRHLLDGRRGALPPRLDGRAGHRRGLPRHRLPLRRDDRHPRRRRGDAAGEPDQHHAEADGRRAGRRVRQGPVRPRPRPVLRAAQGRSR